MPSIAGKVKRAPSQYNKFVADYMKKADVKGKGKSAVSCAFKEATKAWKVGKKAGTVSG
jgi:hypothetical protein